jgi:hypothetical protein
MTWPAVRITKLPLDDRNTPIVDGAIDLICDRISLTDAWKEIQFVNDIKAFSILVNSVSAGSVAFRGTLPGSKEWLAAVAVIDNGDGTVTLHTGALHNFTVGDDVEIHGTTYFDGTWGLESGSTGDHIIITPDAYSLDLEGAVVADAGAGKVTIPCTNVFNDGDTITISGSDNYDATYTLDAASTAAAIVVTAAYSAETFAAEVIASGFPTETTAVTDYAVGYRDVLLAASVQTPELKIVAEVDVTVCSLKCATGAATAVVSIYARR